MIADCRPAGADECLGNRQPVWGHRLRRADRTVQPPGVSSLELHLGHSWDGPGEDRDHGPFDVAGKGPGDRGDATMYGRRPPTRSVRVLVETVLHLPGERAVVADRRSQDVPPADDADHRPPVDYRHT